MIEPSVKNGKQFEMKFSFNTKGFGSPRFPGKNQFPRFIFSSRNGIVSKCVNVNKHDRNLSKLRAHFECSKAEKLLE